MRTNVENAASCTQHTTRKRDRTATEHDRSIGFECVSEWVRNFLTAHQHIIGH